MGEVTHADAALSLGSVKDIIKSNFKPKEVVQLVNDVIVATTGNQIPEIQSS